MKKVRLGSRNANWIGSTIKKGKETMILKFMIMTILEEESVYGRTSGMTDKVFLMGGDFRCVCLIMFY